MALVSLKLPGKDKSKHGPEHGQSKAMVPGGEEAGEGYREEYPLGARLCLEGDIIATLGLAGVTAGTEVHLTAVGVVERVEAEAGQSGVTGLCIQLTELEAKPERAPHQGLEAMYGPKGRSGDSTKSGTRPDIDGDADDSGDSASANRLYGPTRNRS